MDYGRIRPYGFFAIFMLVAHLTSGYRDDDCHDGKKLGRILDLVVSPQELHSGLPINVTLRLYTPYKPNGAWYLQEYKHFRRRGYVKLFHQFKDENITFPWLFNVYPVPEKDDGDIRANFRYEGGDTYVFSLQLASYVHLHELFRRAMFVHFAMQLDHPCNTITVSLRSGFNGLKNMTGVDLPTPLFVPKPVVDLRRQKSARMKVGLSIDPALEVDAYYASFADGRKNGEMFTRDGLGSQEPVRMGWEDASGRRSGHPEVVNNTIEGVMTLAKIPDEVGDIDGLAVLSLCRMMRREGSYLYGDEGEWLEVMVTTLVLLKDSEKPAVGLSVNQNNHKIRNPTHKYFYDTDGTRIIPFVNDPIMVMPVVIECSAMSSDGETTPDIAAAVINGDKTGFTVRNLLTPIGGEDLVGYARRFYEIPPLPVGETASFNCRAAEGNTVSSGFVRVISTENVKVTSENKSYEPLNNSTFRGGYNFTCRAESGSPTPSVKFLAIPNSKWDQRMSFSSRQQLLDEWKELDPVETNTKTVIGPGGEVTLVIPPGEYPYPRRNESFNLVCFGYNRFASDNDFVEFYKMVTM